MPDLGTPLSTGRTAEVYPWGDGQVVKLIRPGFPSYLADQEARGALAACQAGQPAPRPGELVQINGRRGIILERVDGPLLTQILDRQPYRVISFGRLLGQLHARTHAACSPNLPSQRERIARNLQSSICLSDVLKRTLLERLAALPDGDRLCHGDFHIYNIIYSSRGPVVVDWESATRGIPSADLARTRLMTIIAARRTPGFRGWFFRRVGSLFDLAYLSGYRQAAAVPINNLDTWLAIQAALQMQEDNRPEWAFLESIIHAHLPR